MTATEISYRKSAIEGASSIGLMIALLDTLVGDFRRAADALRKNDIETRCRELNHATLVLVHLESWLDLEKGGESAQNLARFYAYLRAKMLEAGAKQSASVLDMQIDMILHVRSSWQQLDSAPPNHEEIRSATSSDGVKTSYASGVGAEPERIRFSQSA
jgi:flagellar protein FliS